MKKIVIHRPGGYDRLRLEEHPDPSPGPGEVRVDVEAVGVNYADCITRMGLYASANRLVGFPITPGFELAGRVGATGPDVEGHARGARVLGLTLFGAYASRIVLPVERVLPIPDDMDTETASGFPTVFLTAWFAVFELAHPRAGDTVLVHSAAGGVGQALVQLAKHAGCRVVAVVGASHKVETARWAGANVVIDKSRDALWPAAEAACPEGYQAVFDANGVSTLIQSYRHLAPMGRLVVYGFHGMLPRRGGRPSRLKLAWDYLRTPRFDPVRMTGANRSVLAFNLSLLGGQAARLHEGLEQLLAWYRQGVLRPAPTTVYPFEEVARAHRDLESGATVGKLVLRV